MNITILGGTGVLVLGVFVYTLYKRKVDRGSRRVLTSYEEKCIELDSDFIYFDKGKR